MRLGLVVVCVGWALGGIGVAAADSPHARSAYSSYPGVQALLNPDGTGQLFANSNSVGWSWQSCTVSAPVVCAAAGSGNPIDTGDPPTGTFFVGTSSSGDSVLSPVWDGTVQAIRPPMTFPLAVVGAVRANGYVTAVPAFWTGGWAGDFDQPQLAACANADGTNCTSLTDPEFEPIPPLPPSCGSGATVIDPVFTGWYLRVADVLFGPGTTFAGVAHFSPYGASIWQAGPLTAVAVAGRIAAAGGPRTAQCGPLPLPPNADPHHPGWCSPGQQPPLACSTVVVSPKGRVDVWCVFSRCRVSITAAHRRVTVRYTTTAFGLAHLALPERLIAKLGYGRALLTVDVNGRPAASRQVRFNLTARGRPGRRGGPP